jgi:AcrR family transcriptional regulator
VRSDARRNRDLIVATASALLTERGAAVSMEEIARAAGLGVGTLYRHFPDRQALLEDIAADGAARLLEAGHAAQASGRDGWTVLLELMRQCADLPLALIKELGAGQQPSPPLRRRVEELNELFARTIAQAQRDGALRADIPPAEVVSLLNVMICRPGARVEDYLSTVILDGLRAEPAASRPAGSIG